MTLTELFLELLQKKAQSNKKNLALEDEEWTAYYTFGGTIYNNLMYRDKQLFIDLVTDFLNNPTVERTDWFSGQFAGLYDTFDKQVDTLKEQMLTVNNEKALAKCKELLTPETKNGITFSNAVGELWWYCDLHNPELSKEDDLYYNDEQLKQACEKFLDKVKEL